MDIKSLLFLIMRFFRMCALAFIATASSVAFVACSDDDNESNDTGTTGSLVNPSNVFTAGVPKQVGSMSVVTDANGLITSMSSREDGVEIEFSYSGASRAESYDVVMRVREEGYTDVCNILLNNDGFAKYCQEIESDGGIEEWWFEYNSAGQLSKMRRTEGDNEVTQITYENGNITKVVVTSDDSDGNNSYTIKYGASLLENKGCLMLFDETFGIDMDEMGYAYFAGLLGKATKNLPVEKRDTKYGDEDTYSWSFNGAGLPVKLESTYTGDGWTDSQTYEFKW